MSNRFVQRAVVLSAGFQPVSAESLVVSGELACDPDNDDAVVVRDADGVEIAWSPGEFHELRSVDLATVSVRGAAGDVVRFVGGTW